MRGEGKRGERMKGRRKGIKEQEGRDDRIREVKEGERQ